MADDSGDIKLNIFVPHSSSSIKPGKKAAKQRQLQYEQRTKRRRRYRGGEEKQTNSTFKRFAAKSDRPSPQAKDQKSDFATFVPKKDQTKKVTFADIDGDEAPKNERKPEFASFVKRNAPLKRKKGDAGLVKKAKTSLKEQPAEFASFVKAGKPNKKKKVTIHPAEDEDEPVWLSRKRKSADPVDYGEEIGEGMPRKARKAGDGGIPHRGKVTSLFGNNPDIPDVPRRVVRPVQESVFSNEEFSELPIHSYSVANLRSLGLTRMTTVQRKAAPELLAGRDALVRSQTGSGKTLAYALPLVELLQRVDPPLTRADGVQALVVLPTRELALQTYEWLVKLVKPFVRLVPGYLVGGEKLKSEKARLRKGVSILVGTPGRLMDHVQNTRCLRLDRVRCLVLDEADCMLDMGYERDVASLVSALDSQSAPLLPPEAFSCNRKVFSSDSDSDREDAEGEGEAAAASTPELGVGKGRRQTVLLSATLTPAVERLAGLALRSPVFVDAADETTAEHDLVVVPESLEQSYVLAPAKLRLVTLAAFILSKCKLSKERKMLLFCATQDMVDYLTELLTSVLGRDGDDSDDEGMEGHLTLDIDFFRLQGSMDQKERVQVFQTFRAAASGVLLCTDVAARGLDLPRVDWTVQYNAPASVAAYVHRVGRTARVGAPGSALLFLAPSEVDFVQMLQERRIRLKEETVERCLQQLALVSCSGDVSQKALASPEAAATALQQRFENVVLDRRSLHILACKAYVSFVRFYASYPLEVRDVFNFKALHLGHYAKSFALRDPPTAIAGIGRRQYLKEREQQSDGKPVKRKRKPTGAGSATAGGAGAGLFLDRKRTRDLLISEFASGLEPKRKKKKNPGMPNM